MTGEGYSPLQALIEVAPMRPPPLAYEAIAGLWATAVGWDDHVRNQDAARAEADRDPGAAQLRQALSPAISPREEEELRTRSESAACELRALVGTVGGVDLVDTAMRLHRDERSVMDNAMLSPDETFWTIARLRARAFRLVRPSQ